MAEPTEHNAILMVRGVGAREHHRVQVLDEAIEAAVRLSHRYIPARQLPDKAVSLLDTASARVAVSQHAVPAELEDCRRRIESLQIELDIIGREDTVGIEVTDRRAAASKLLAEAEEKRGGLEERWQKERELVDRILAIRADLRKGSEPVEGTGSKLEQAAQAQIAAEPTVPAKPSAEDRARLLAELNGLHKTLTDVQGDSPLILPSVDEHAVASVVQDWTGVPVGHMVRNELEAVINLTDTLNKRVIGQRHALEMIARRIQTSRARLDNPNKPIGVFVCGPSGVGKTETALALAEALYGGNRTLSPST